MVDQRRRHLLAALALCALPAFANVLDPNTVDFVVVEQDGTLYLDIVQHLPWGTDTYERLDRKVDAYVRYYVTGAIFKAHPHLAGKPAVIRVVYVEPPGPAALWRLEAVRSRIKPRGIGLVWVPLTGPPKTSTAG
jgi:hypothetical protein